MLNVSYMPLTNIHHTNTSHSIISFIAQI